MIFVDWNTLIRHIDRSLPGKGLWMQCVPVLDDDAPTEEGVGLAVQRESVSAVLRSGEDLWYSVVFFRVVPDPAATRPDGDFLQGRGDTADDWEIIVGYQVEHETLEEAIDEAKGLSRDLPKSTIYPTTQKLAAALDQVEDPEALDDIA